MEVSFFVPELLKEFKDIPSYAVAQFKSFLKVSGFDPKIILKKCADNDFSDVYGNKLVEESINQVHDSFSGKSQRVLLISAWYYNLPFVLEFIRRYRKKYDDNTIMILGGYAATYSTGTIFEILGKDLDFAIKGNGYSAMRELLEYINCNEDNFKERSVIEKLNITIRGVSYVQEGSLIKNGLSERIDIDDLPIPDYSFTGEEHIEKLYLKTSDGCKYNDCLFCTSEKFNRYQEKSILTLEHEFKEYKARYGTKFLVIIDNTFLCDKDRAIKISTLLKKYDLDWSCYSRIEIEESLVEAMIKNNCKNIFFGYDTPNEKNFTENNKSKIPFKDYQEKSKTMFRKMTELMKSNKNFHANFAVIDFKGNKDLEPNDNKNGIKIHSSKLQYLPGTKYYEQNPEKFIFDENPNFFYDRYVSFFRKPEKNQNLKE